MHTNNDLISSPPTPGTFLMSTATLEKVQKYLESLQATQKPGKYLQALLDESKISLDKMDISTFTHLLLQTKLPQIFAESGTFRQNLSWTLEEESILGDISFYQPTHFFNDGGHGQFTSYLQPMKGTLAFIPGALLRDKKGGVTADKNEVIVDDSIDQEKFYQLYERRLVPALFRINEEVGQKGKHAVITVPGIGTGVFAGKYPAKVAFRKALEDILTNYADKLPNIRAVHYDPYSCEDNIINRTEIGHIIYSVQPSSFVKTTNQLAYPAFSEPNDELFSLVAWDHFSWPGNDFWKGLRMTDDGVKGASSDVMFCITKEPGVYNQKEGSYDPVGFGTWFALVKEKGIKLTADIVVFAPDGSQFTLYKDVKNEKKLSQDASEQNDLSQEEKVSAQSVSKGVMKEAIRHSIYAQPQLDKQEVHEIDLKSTTQL